MRTKLKSRATRGHQISAVPRGVQPLTPGLTVQDVEKAVEFYQKAFGAELQYQMRGSDNRTVIHAELRIGDAVIMVGAENPERGLRSPQSTQGSPVTLNLYLNDVDAAYVRAIEAGAHPLQPVEAAFWGDRTGKMEDPFGHVWGLCTRIEDLPPGEVSKRGREWMARMKVSRS